MLLHGHSHASTTTGRVSITTSREPCAAARAGTDSSPLHTLGPWCPCRSPCCAPPAAAPLLLLSPPPTSVKKPAALGPSLLLVPLLLGSFTTGSTTSTAFALLLLPLLLLALPLLLAAPAPAAAAANGAAGFSCAGLLLGLLTRCANFSPLLASAAAAAGVPGATGVAVVSTGGVKPGLKGLAAP